MGCMQGGHTRTDTICEALLQGLASAIRHVIQSQAAKKGQSATSTQQQVLSAVLRTACVLLLPPLQPFGSGDQPFPSHPACTVLYHCMFLLR